MFGLMYNFYKFCKEKSERKITLAFLGLDNAGKTTLLNTMKGDVEQDTIPTFGFNSSNLQDGKYKIEVFDLGGGKTFRSVWSRYLAEVHAIVYVVDAADAQRFEESKKALQDVLECQYMREKAILVFANKQDLPTASTAAEVIKGLGLATYRNSHNVFPCSAKKTKEAPVDERLREGLHWLTTLIDREYARLDARVQVETAEVKLEEARKKKEREERLRLQREERLRLQKEEEDRAREIQKENALHNGQAPALLTLHADGSLEQHQSLHPEQSQGGDEKAPALHQGLVLGLPHTIDSPGKPLVTRRVVGVLTSDLEPSATDQGLSAGAVGAVDGDSAANRFGPSAAPRMCLPPRPSSAQSRASEGSGGGGGLPTAAGVAPGRPPSAGHKSGGVSGGGSSSSSPSRPSAASPAGEPAAEAAEETAGGYPRSRLVVGASGFLGPGAVSEAVPRGSFSLAAQNNKVVPVDSVGLAA